MNKKDLLYFTEDIKKAYEAGKIRAPIHLGGYNEDALIKVFRKYKKGDWIFSTWRSSYHWLLSGRDPEELKKQILEGHSMHIYGDRFFTSAIVAGIGPIAVGIALALKLKGAKEHVWCFLGDSSYMCGISKECIRYSEGHDLPITFVIEDNGLSVNANTQEIWGVKKIKKVIKYKYRRRFPHSGTGRYIMF